MERKPSYEIEILLKKYVDKKVTAIESNVFRKSNRSKKVALQKM